MTSQTVFLFCAQLGISFLQFFSSLLLSTRMLLTERDVEGLAGPIDLCHAAAMLSQETRKALFMHGQPRSLYEDSHT